MKKDTRRLIAVGSGFENKNERSSQSLKLLSWGFRNSDTYEISKLNKTFYELKTWLGKSRILKADTKKDIYITLDKKDSRYLKVMLEYKGPIKAPIYKGDEVGKLIIFKKDEKLDTIPIFASENIEKVNFFKSIFTSLNYMIWGDV